MPEAERVRPAGKVLAVYLMAGPEAPDLAEAAVSGGADIVEVGFPFSDPLADGPVILAEARRALADGMRTGACLDCLAEIRARVDVPLVPMTYAAVLEAYGVRRFAGDARSAGASALIVADLPLEVWPEVERVQLVAPTTPAERIRLAAERTAGWLYLVSVTGTTGPRDGLSPQLAPLVARARRVTDRPLLAGFGISTPEQAARAAALADGVVVGSRVMQVARASGPGAVLEYVSSLRRAVDGARAVAEPGPRGR
jgi:tryptophan synthase alpha chain